MIVNSDHNLLFGMLAVQLDIVSKDDLIRGFHDWMLDKSKTVDEVMLAQGVLTEKDRSILLPLVELHIERHGGDAKVSIAAITVDPSLPAALEQNSDVDLKASVALIATKCDAADASTGVESRQYDKPTLTQESPVAHGGGAVPQTAELNRYRYLRPHAEGGIGRVSVARDLQLNRDVAFKEIKQQFAKNAGARQRFLTEAEITARLEHPGIVPVYSVGQLADGRPFYAMKFVRGTTLSDVARDFHSSYASESEVSRKIKLRELLQHFIDVCNAVGYAHSRGIVHRDLKPANIMIGEFGEALVVDWGLAKSIGRPEFADVDDHSATLQPDSAKALDDTQSGSVLGTPYYMSPEQAVGRVDEIDWLSDVYSLGATLYELLTGLPPVISEHGDDEKQSISLKEMLERVAFGKFARARELNSNVPAALDAVCSRAMSLDKTHRYQSARSLAKDIESWLADGSISVRIEPLGEEAERYDVRVARSLVELIIAYGRAANGRCPILELETGPGAGLGI